MTSLSILDAAQLAGLSEKTIRRKIRFGILPAHVEGRGGQKRKMVNTDDLERVFGPLPEQGSVEPDEQRRHRTGRNQQLNIKATAETIAHLNRFVDELGVPQGEVLARAVKALSAELRAAAPKPAASGLPVPSADLPSPARAIDAHYSFEYDLTDADRERGRIMVDPYFVARQWRTGSKDDSGVLFHLLKNIARFGDKNSREREIVALYKSIRRLAALEGVELEP